MIGDIYIYTYIEIDRDIYILDIYIYVNGIIYYLVVNGGSYVYYTEHARGIQIFPTNLPYSMASQLELFPTIRKSLV